MGPIQTTPCACLRQSALTQASHPANMVHLRHRHTMTISALMNRQRDLAFAFALLLGVSLAGCSRQDAPAAKITAVVAPTQAYDAVAKDGKGFAAGALMSSQTVYVLFDAQCPHCGALWNASLPLHKKVKFVWVPVSLMNAKSTAQGAALLTAANPTELMTAHESALLAGNGGMAADPNPSPDAQAAIKSNTLLFNSLGATSVPYIVAKNARTGEVVTNSGALQTPALAAFLGLE